MGLNDKISIEQAQRAYDNALPDEGPPFWICTEKNCEWDNSKDDECWLEPDECGKCGSKNLERWP